METLDISCCIEDFSETEIMNEIPVVQYEDVQYEQFFEKFMLHNNPIIIKNICNKWKSSNDWVTNDNINYDYFLSNFGEFEAPVADCNKTYFNAQCKCNMKIKEYMSYLKTKDKHNLLYLKDWHLKAKLRDENIPSDFYKVPICFASDWLNEYAEDKQEDDFQFVYIGTKNTWTPLHADVYSSFSWSVNVVGKKKWVLFPPGEEEKLKDSLGNLPLLFKPEQYNNIKYFEVIQEKGDGIFVPSGWHHQVLNILETISINHNFINSCNIDKVWQALQKNLMDVENEIAEFKESPEFLNQCQIILKSLFGMDFSSFVNFIIYIARKRLNQIQGENFIIFDTYTFGINHITFDLKVLYKMLKLIENHPLFTSKVLKNNLRLQHFDVIKDISNLIH